MQLGTVLETAIGLAFAFFLLSLVASAIQEVIASVFKWRGTSLARSIEIIISNAPDAGFAWTNAADWLRAHLTTGPAAALPVSPDPVLRRVTGGMSSHPLLRGNPTPLPSYVSAQAFSMALLEVLRDGTSLPLFGQVESTVAALPPGSLRTILATFVQDAGGDLDRFRGNVEHWFDDAMDRASGLYKRTTQYVLVGLGLVLVVGLNVDTLYLARSLWDDPTTRAALTAGATMAVSARADPATGAGTQLSAAYKALQAKQLPIGWRSSRDETIFPRSVLSSMMGWLLTAFAVSLGVPFWFGLLQTLVNIRAAGPKPERADGSTPGAPS